MRLRIYFGGASPNCGAGVRPYLIRRPALAHKNPTRFSRGSMSRIEVIKRAGDDAVDDTLAGAPEHPLVHGGTGCCMPALPIAVKTRLHDACKKHESWQGRGR